MSSRLNQFGLFVGGGSVAQASRDLEVDVNVRRKWVRDLAADPAQGFPGHGQMKPEQLEIGEKLRSSRRSVTS